MARAPKQVLALAGLFVVSGVMHLVRPHSYESMVPVQLPARRSIVYASGVAELACAAALLHPQTRQGAGWASASLLVAVFPANVQMAVSEGSRARHQGGNRARLVATLARLPLQIPLIRAALRAARGT